MAGLVPIGVNISRHSGAPRSGEPGIHSHDFRKFAPSASNLGALGLWIPGSHAARGPRNDGLMVWKSGESFKLTPMGLVPAIHAFESTRKSRRGCPRHKGVYARLRRAMRGHD